MGPLIRSLTFLSVSDYLVCLDDLERRSDGLSLRAVLGLVSMLREQRACRIIVIFNDDALSGEDGAEIGNLKDKVFDYELAFEPSPADCATHIFGDTLPYALTARAHAAKLGITNMRVLKRAKRVLDIMLPHVASLHENMTAQVVHTTMLAAWAHAGDGSDAPPLEYVRNLSVASFIREGSSNEKEQQWNGQLEAYGFMTSDDLDKVVCDCVSDGFVDEAQRGSATAQVLKALEQQDLLERVSKAWDLFGNSFANNGDEVAEELYASSRAAAVHISAANISTTVELLRDLGNGDAADELIRHWVEAQLREDPASLDLSKYPFASDVRDRALREAIGRAHRHSEAPKSLAEVVRGFAGSSGWDPEDVQVLQGGTAEDYIALFKALPPEEFRPCVRACLKFSSFSDADPDYKRIAVTVSEALERIGSENALNRRRVAALGIQLPV